MDTTTKQLIADRLAQLYTEGLSQSKMAAEITNRFGAISNATISNMINGKWDSIALPMWQRAGQYTKSLKVSGFEWVDMSTQNGNIIKNVVASAHIEKDVRAICAATGLGKTTELQRQSSANEHYYYVLLSRSMTVKDIVRAIAASMYINHDGSTYSYIKKISERLNTTGGVLIIDDIGKVIRKFYGQLQELIDHTTGHAGIVIAGTIDLKRWLDKMKSKQRDSYPELHRRISHWQGLKAPSRQSIELVCRQYGITHDSAIAFLFEHAKNYGSLKEYIKNAVKITNQEITSSVLGALNVGDQNF